MEEFTEPTDAIEHAVLHLLEGAFTKRISEDFPLLGVAVLCCIDNSLGAPTLKEPWEDHKE